ncbi:hypothetical protein RM533_11075 [Croceicoccus sp. F390]|uniref:Secreted protein n=1 Tax=Croceicoccus esteveae TaxID=3075597 RepID=A0ABU2ZJD8_9SPHN|nr:hypothetical protein [Croceicoccus sp. F390]MDT0576718.1 hypothetical protein [Croceicoccus sp. F390]
MKRSQHIAGRRSLALVAPFLAAAVLTGCGGRDASPAISAEDEAQFLADAAEMLPQERDEDAQADRGGANQPQGE